MLVRSFALTKHCCNDHGIYKHHKNPSLLIRLNITHFPLPMLSLRQTLQASQVQMESYRQEIRRLATLLLGVPTSTSSTSASSPSSSSTAKNVARGGLKEATSRVISGKRSTPPGRGKRPPGRSLTCGAIDRENDQDGKPYSESKRLGNNHSHPSASTYREESEEKRKKERRRAFGTSGNLSEEGFTTTRESDGRVSERPEASDRKIHGSGKIWVVDREKNQGANAESEEEEKVSGGAWGGVREEDFLQGEDIIVGMPPGGSDAELTGGVRAQARRAPRWEEDRDGATLTPQLNPQVLSRGRRSEEGDGAEGPPKQPGRPSSSGGASRLRLALEKKPAAAPRAVDAATAAAAAAASSYSSPRRKPSTSPAPPARSWSVGDDLAFPRGVGGGRFGEEEKTNSVREDVDDAPENRGPVAWIRADDCTPDIQGKLNGEGRARYSKESEEAGVQRSRYGMEGSGSENEEQRKDESTHFDYGGSPDTWCEPCDGGEGSRTVKSVEVGVGISRGISSSGGDADGDGGCGGSGGCVDGGDGRLSTSREPTPSSRCTTTSTTNDRGVAGQYGRRNSTLAPQSSSSLHHSHVSEETQPGESPDAHLNDRVGHATAPADSPPQSPWKNRKRGKSASGLAEIGAVLGSVLGNVTVSSGGGVGRGDVLGSEGDRGAASLGGCAEDVGCSDVDEVPAIMATRAGTREDRSAPPPGGSLMPPLPVPRRGQGITGLSDERELDEGKGATRSPDGDRAGICDSGTPATSAAKGAKRTGLAAFEDPISRARVGHGRRSDDDDDDDRLNHGVGPALVGTDNENTLCTTGTDTGAHDRDRRAVSQPDGVSSSSTAVPRGERGRKPTEYRQPQPRIIELFRSALASTSSSSDSSGDRSLSGSDRSGEDKDEEDEEGLLQVSLGSECSTDAFAGTEASLGSMVLRYTRKRGKNDSTYKK